MKAVSDREQWTPTDRIVRGIVAHLVADWLLQSDWMARHKDRPGHPAGILHAMIHVEALRFAFPVRWALLLGVLHYLVDLRFALKWWRRVFRQTTDPANPAALHVAIWGDQVVHILAIAIVAAQCRRNERR